METKCYFGEGSKIFEFELNFRRHFFRLSIKGLCRREKFGNVQLGMLKVMKLM